MNYADFMRQYRRINRLKAIHLVCQTKHYSDIEYQVKGKNCSQYTYYPIWLKVTKKDIKVY